MSILREGRMATYIGEGENFGAEAEVLSLAPNSAWVRYVTGARTGELELVDDLDLTPLESRSRYAAATEVKSPPVPVLPQPVMAPVTASRDELDDSLDVGLPMRVGAAAVQQTQGTLGVLTMLAHRGDLHRLSTVVDDALIMVANRIRNDSGVCQITSQLDEDDAENLVQMASLALLHSVFGDKNGR